MPRILRQSTQIVVRIGPAVSVADGFTPVTTLALSTADEAEALRAGTATLDISGATFAAVTGADGWYDLTLTTTATSTVGELVIVIQDDSLILPLYAVFQVVEEAVYDNLFAASAPGALAANTTGTGLTAIPWNTAWDAEVQSEAADALNAYDPPTNAEMVARTLAAASYATATNLATVDTVVDAILADTGTDGVVVAAASKADYALSAAGVDAILDEVVEGTFTLRQMVRLVAAALLGELSGAATTTITIRDASDTKTRITATVDADGNRSALTLDAT